jgi:hypothetical protein
MITNISFEAIDMSFPFNDYQPKLTTNCVALVQS